MTMYLVTYEADDEFLAEFMSVGTIADNYGHMDENGTSNYRVYRLSANTDPEPLTLKIANAPGVGKIVEIRTRNGVLLDDHVIKEE